MELRTALTTAFALLGGLGAALAASACDLPGQAPLICLPQQSDAEPPQQDPACTSCVQDKCADAGSRCESECKAYGECTCDCAEDDMACFTACAENRGDACDSCQQSSANAVVACITDQCQVCNAGAGGGDSNAEGGGDSWPGGGTDDGGGTDGGWSDGGWTDASASDGGGTWGETSDGGSEGGGAACEQLHAQCCPNLSDFDLELCEMAVDETECQVWLDIFGDEGKC